MKSIIIFVHYELASSSMPKLPLCASGPPAHHHPRPLKLRKKTLKFESVTSQKKKSFQFTHLEAFSHLSLFSIIQNFSHFSSETQIQNSKCDALWNCFYVP